MTIIDEMPTHHNELTGVLPGSVLPGQTDDRDVAAAVLSTDGRIARRQRNRERVIEAYVELLREGVSNPTATDIGDRAEVTARSVYRYMREDDTLKADVAQRILVPFRAMSSVGDIGQAAFSDRVDAFVAFRLDLFVRTAPIMRTLLNGRKADDVATEAIEEAHVILRQHMANTFARELALLPSEQCHADLIALQTLLLFDSLEYLHRYVDADDVAAALSRHITAVLDPCGTAVG